MSFYFSSTVYDFLFPGVNVVTTWAMVSLCLGLVTLSILVEGFKVARTQLFKLSLAHQDDASLCHIPQRSPSSLPSWCCCSYEGSSRHRVKFHVLQSFLHVVHLTLGYILMLVVMTYNAYFAFAVIGGAGLGYFFFALFDLPGKILGASSSSSGDKRGLHNTSTRTEGNPSCVNCPYRGPGALVASPVGLHPSTGLERLSHNVSSLDIAFENNVGSFTSEDSVPSRNTNHFGCRDARQENSFCTRSLPERTSAHEDKCDGRDSPDVVSVSDTARLLPQETIKVEVQNWHLSYDWFSNNFSPPVLPLQSTEGSTTHVNSHLVCGKNCNQYKEKKVLDSKINGH
ncbi:hypothetical protein Pcinc_021130 [Petrolisthes cinctipes]|uniref:Copper transport protein n=1 Tax=Petrolisthes cinctipes TaxID=88211 RepID=A0AAE1FHT6_PETCI|nr:hypothetical protein Pcinc_026040 [Petrolisthes cinctipes]KAK3873889.1 hypothetical protein Pcinc_021130 [Petrolisthes cinctipes]